MPLTIEIDCQNNVKNFKQQSNQVLKRHQNYNWVRS